MKINKEEVISAFVDVGFIKCRSDLLYYFNDDEGHVDFNVFINLHDKHLSVLIKGYNMEVLIKKVKYTLDQIENVIEMIILFENVRG